MIFRIYCYTLSGIEQVERFKRDNITNISELLNSDIPLEFVRLDTPPSAKTIQRIRGKENMPKSAKFRFSVLNDKYENTCHWIK